MNGDNRVLISGAKIVDGSGNPWFYGDIVLRGDTIAEIVPSGRADASNPSEKIDATGLIACPGFIDIQSHSIVPFLTDRRSLSKITQGVTTEIMGSPGRPPRSAGALRIRFGTIGRTSPVIGTPGSPFHGPGLASATCSVGRRARVSRSTSVRSLAGALSASGAKAWPWARPTPPSLPP